MDSIITNQGLTAMLTSWK